MQGKNSFEHFFNIEVTDIVYNYGNPENINWIIPFENRKMKAQEFS